MKRQIMQLLSLALLVALTASLTIPGASARYLLAQSQLSGEINFTAATRTDTFYITNEEGDEEPHLWGNDVKDSDGTLMKPTSDILDQYGIDKTNQIVYPLANVSGADMHCSFAVSFCAMDYTQIKHSDKNQLLVNYHITFEVNRADGTHETLTIDGVLVTDLDPTALEQLGAVRLEMGEEPQYSGKSPGSGNVDYKIYSAFIDPTLDSMVIGSEHAMKKTVNGVTSDAVDEDFIIHHGDRAECTLQLTFDGSFHSNTNADACYASIGLVAEPVAKN